MSRVRQTISPEGHPQSAHTYSSGYQSESYFNLNATLLHFLLLLLSDLFDRTQKFTKNKNIQIKNTHNKLSGKKIKEMSETEVTKREKKRLETINFKILILTFRMNILNIKNQFLHFDNLSKHSQKAFNQITIILIKKIMRHCYTTTIKITSISNLNRTNNLYIFNLFIYFSICRLSHH